MHFIGKLILCGLVTAASAILAYKVGEHKGKTERETDWEDWVDDDENAFDWGSCSCDDATEGDSSCICNRCGCKDLCGGGVKAKTAVDEDVTAESKSDDEEKKPAEEPKPEEAAEEPKPEEGEGQSPSEATE